MHCSLPGICCPEFVAGNLLPGIFVPGKLHRNSNKKGDVTASERQQKGQRNSIGTATKKAMEQHWNGNKKGNGKVPEKGVEKGAETSLKKYKKFFLFFYCKRKYFMYNMYQFACLFSKPNLFV